MYNYKYNLIILGEFIMKKLFLAALIVGTFATGCMRDKTSSSTSSVTQQTTTSTDKTSSIISSISSSISDVITSVLDSTTSS